MQFLQSQSSEYSKRQICAFDLDTESPSQCPAAAEDATLCYLHCCGSHEQAMHRTSLPW